ncbi:MAG: hypothetical protein JW936_01270 [Sedimentisphaerales bacterium]|nr:hypothetical protein [Sedimentisphaerales bacterium]
MSIVEVRYMGRETSSSKRAAGVGTFAGNHGEVYEVEFSAGSNPRTMEMEALDCPNIPQMWEVHFYDPWMFVVASEGSWKSPTCVRVVVQYDRVADPLAERPTVRWSHANSSEQIDVDINGDPITGSSNETYEDPVTKDIPDVVLYYQDNVAAFDHLQATDFIKSLNDRPCFGHAVKTGRIMVYDGEEMRAGDLTYWRRTLEMHFRDDGWAVRRSDQGYRIVTGTDENGCKTYQTITDDEGNPLTSPSLLDGNGGLLPDGADPVWNEHEIYKERNWDNLGINLEG